MFIAVSFFSNIAKSMRTAASNLKKQVCKIACHFSDIGKSRENS